jgi:hypothetical protein
MQELWGLVSLELCIQSWSNDCQKCYQYQQRNNRTIKYYKYVSHLISHFNRSDPATFMCLSNTGPGCITPYIVVFYCSRSWGGCFFVDIDSIFDNHCFNFVYITLNLPSPTALASSIAKYLMVNVYKSFSLAFVSLVACQALSNCFLSSLKVLGQ